MNRSSLCIWKTTGRLLKRSKPGVLTMNAPTTRNVPATTSYRSFSSSSSGGKSSVIVETSYADNHRAAEERNTKKLLNNPEHSQATALVDDLLKYTRELMGSPEQHRKHIVAFSGGVDSSLVLALLEHSKMENIETVYGVLGRSPAVPQDQLKLARTVAQTIGSPHYEVTTSEGSDETYIANEGQACLACKTHLYSALEAVAQHASDEQEQQQQLHNHNNADDQSSLFFQLYNGTNADDAQDATRVGLIAAQNFHVQSPLRFTTKDNVRVAARHLGLPNWNVAASPCLRSRLALGVKATQEHLQRIELAESFVKKELRDVLQETSNLRVRLMAGNRARLEIDKELLSEIESRRRKSRHWEEYFVGTLGFESMSTRAFRSGSVATKEDSGKQEKRNHSEGDVSDMDALQQSVAY